MTDGTTRGRPLTWGDSCESPAGNPATAAQSGAAAPRAGRRLRLPGLGGRRVRDAATAISYARPTDPLARRVLIRTLEALSGRRALERLYRRWRERVGNGHPRPFHLMLEEMGIGLTLRGCWPPATPLPERLVVVCNHPFGIGDGAALMALAETIGRPARVLVHNDLMQVPEMARFGLPVSFDATREALQLNMRTKRRAAELLTQGVTIVVFPAGAVATAPTPFGRAQDLPWKTFAAGLARAADAAILPVHCAGQNGPVFHLASRVSQTVRIGLLVGEFRRLRGRRIVLTAGRAIAAHELRSLPNRRVMTDYLRERVFELV